MLPLESLLRINFNETIYVYLRRHWWIFLKKFLALVLLILLPIVIKIVIVTINPYFFSDNSLLVLANLSLLIYYLFIWVIFFNQWVNYYFDIWVVTDQQIIDAQQNGLFNHRIIHLPIDQVRNISASSKGFLPTLLNYGKVLINTADEAKGAAFLDIPDPFKVADQINDIVQKVRAKETSLGDEILKGVVKQASR
jgi:membrane protein YdbS with pleckstrin-like domain